MYAITMTSAGGPDVLSWSTVPDPEPRAGEVVVTVAASAVNRADLMQRMGHYPPPPGASDIIGLECSGIVSALGDGVSGWSVGDEVCALLAGGGYAERVAVPAGQLLPAPATLDLVSAAALPEVVCTVWSNVFQIGRARAGQTLLVHGGSSGIGTMAIQLAKRAGLQVLCTAGTATKLARCRELGADLAVNYREEDFVARARQHTGGAGVDVILDNMGAKYLAGNVKALAPDGHLIIIGLQGGRAAELDLGLLLSKRASVTATSLRGRPLQQKADIVSAVRQQVWAAFADGGLHPVIDRVLPMRDAARAHQVVEASEHVGKVVLATG